MGSGEMLYAVYVAPVPPTQDFKQGMVPGGHVRVTAAESQI